MVLATSLAGMVSALTALSGPMVNEMLKVDGKCPTGRFIQSNDGMCAYCPAGKYQDTLGQESCKDCPDGTSSSFSASKSEDLCVECTHGRYVSVAKTECTACVAGKANSLRGMMGATDCVDCYPGMFSAEGQEKCGKCPAGKHASKFGSTECTDCTAGRHVAWAGASHAFYCSACNTGHAQRLPGQAHCTACQPGTYNELTGQAHCSHCMPGQFMQPGKIRSTISSDCRECPAGKFAAGYASSVCLECHAGKYNTAIHATYQSLCFWCPNGKWQPTTGHSGCKACAAGKIGQSGQQGATSSDHCVHCPSGRFQERDGMIACDQCPSGKFSNHVEDESSNLGYHKFCRECPKTDELRYEWTDNLAGQASCVPHPLNCDLGDWTNWLPCSKSCESGTQKKVRIPNMQLPCNLETGCDQAWGGGIDCKYYSVDEVRSCNMHPCPIDCTMDAWESGESAANAAAAE